MNGVALKILLGDRAKYIGLIFGIAFSTMLMSNQISIFAGLMLRTAGQILDAREADIWVMDPRVEDLACGAQHQPAEDRDLVRHQHRREGDTEDQAEIFGPIAEQDSERHTIHPSLQGPLGGGAARRRFPVGPSRIARPCGPGLDHP